ncbi:GntR family transcriptional regulator [Atopobacter sp. AH10]|uniref:GntR family transcriptional regulator n=1 Tax=Atopobacter sp. AH10 TaxID=2315861 RepID=UPI000EF22AED|nr:GntR family transcriptional regulator [Atopobacter sp. AH10]RLK63525.1 GntR family transcriptional regulator [Atopobacter sp. AH10]
MLMSSSPLYVQLKSYITKLIENEFEVNQQIPSEFELMEKYRVSRTTVRKAIDELVKEGVIVKKQGIGTFVVEKKIHQEISDFSSCSAQLKMMGYCPSYLVKKAKICLPKPSIASKLGLNNDEKIFDLERVTYVQDEPLCITESCIPYKYIQGIENNDFSNVSLYKVIKESYGISVLNSFRSIEIIMCDDNLGEELNILENTPILKFKGEVEGLLRDKSVAKIEYFKTYYRTDRIKFYISQKAHN